MASGKRYSAHAGRVGLQPGTDVTVTADTSPTCSQDAVQPHGSVLQQQEVQRRLTRVISGCLDDLPPLQSKIVRIFTSSTFTGQTQGSFTPHPARHGTTSRVVGCGAVRCRNAPE